MKSESSRCGKHILILTKHVAKNHIPTTNGMATLGKFGSAIGIVGRFVGSALVVSGGTVVEKELGSTFSRSNISLLP